MIATWIVIAAIVLIIAGPKQAQKIVTVPIKWAAGLLADAVHGLLKFGLDLLGGALRGIGRLANRGIRAALHLPPPAPAPRRLPRRRRRDDDDRDDDED